MKFVDAILSNNSTDDHIREFVQHNGLEPLIKILSLPNLPLDFPSSSACQSIGIISRSILFLCQEHQLLQKGLDHLASTLDLLKPLNDCLTKTGQSVLLQEIIKNPKPFQAINSFHQTPLLHGMCATQSFVNMFTYIAKSIQNDVRTICINHWGEKIKTLQQLCQLYTALVWESSVLLSLCTKDVLPEECIELKQDLQRLQELVENDAEPTSSEDVSYRLSDDVQQSNNGRESSSEKSQNREDITATSSGSCSKSKSKSSSKLRILKQLLAAASRLGRSLAEFFSLLARLAVGSGQRQRRPPQLYAPPGKPTLPGKLIAATLAKLLSVGLSWKEPEDCHMPHVSLTYYICSLSFVHPMLFDDRKDPYHLMLQQFVASKGLKSLYDRFYWVITRQVAPDSSTTVDIADLSALPEGSEEFVNAWLALVERLVNPRLILDSSHTIPKPLASESSSSKNAFLPKQFLGRCQKVR